MLFQRRHPESAWQKARIALWPRTSYGRSARYAIKRVLRLRASPHAIAVGVAAGVFSAFNPFLGVHTLIAVAIAWALSGNMIAAAVSTWFGNPLTYPFIWAGTWELGTLLTGGEAGGHMPRVAHGGFSFQGLAEIWEPLLKPMLVGSVPAGLAAGILAYWIARKASGAFADARADRLAEARAKWEAQT